MRMVALQGFLLLWPATTQSRRVKSCLYQPLHRAASSRAPSCREVRFIDLSFPPRREEAQ